MKNHGNQQARYLLILVLIYVVLAAGIVIAGYSYYNNYAANYRAQVDRQLSSIADLKSSDLEHWRQERLGDATLFYKNTVFSRLVQRYFKDAGDAEAEAQLRTWLGNFQAGGQYERLMLLDTGYVKKMVVPEAPERDTSYVSPATSRILQSGKVAFEDFYYNAVNEKIYLKVMIPITDLEGDGRMIGFLALRIDPESYLYPMVQRWPAASETAETLIVRRDGDEVLFLNELRFQKDTALKLRIPVEEIDRPSVKGVLGYEGIVEGTDYRGAEVIAAVRSIADSPWVLVTRMDTAEVYSPLTHMLWVVIVIAAALLIGAGAGAGMIWRQVNHLYYLERAEVADALRESEEKYRLLAEHMKDTVWLMDMDLKTIYQSPSAEKLRGFTLEEIIALPLEAHLTAQSLKLAYQVFVEELPRVKADHSYNPVRTLELEYFRKDGSTVWTESKFSIIRDVGGKAVSILAEARDISDRKKVEEVLRDSEEKYRNVVENADEAIIVAQGGLIKFANRKMEELSGYTREELLSMVLIEFVHPDDRQYMVESDFRKLRGDKFVSAHPVRMIDRQGHIIWMEVSAVVIKWQGRPAVLNFVSDITVRMQSEEALRLSEERYRLLIENSHDIIYTLTTDGVFTFVSPAWTVLLGHPLDQVVGRPFQPFVHQDDLPACMAWLQKVIETGQRQEGIEYRVQHKDGSWYWHTSSAVPLKNKAGKVIGFEGIARDITEHRRLEEERQRVQKLESIGLLAGGIAHDFNNILTAILGNISLAGMEAKPGSELQRSLQQAEKASLRAKDLTVQLLTFSKGGAPVMKVIALAELLRDTAGFALRGSNVKCHFTIAADLWHAEIDSGQVSQVIHNLVLNAQQAMPKGGDIEIRADNMALSKTWNLGRELPLREGNYIRISVTDYGTGIPAENLAKVFDPFFTTKQKGSGLGLATSFSIARQHGGHISVKSEPGSGSTFYFYLPASTKTVSRKNARREAVKPSGAARILVMDDEAGVREVAGRMLRHLGYSDIEFAADGADAIKLYKAAMKSGRQFSVVIMDLTIPGGMGGEVAVEKLLKIDPGVKAVVSSGYAEDPVIANYRGYGFRGMIAKPYTLEELRTVLHDVIGE